MTINAALLDLQPLVGRWRMELYNAAFLPDPDTRVSGLIEIDWIEGGSALRMRQGDAEHPPAAVWIIGRDDSEARIYRMSFNNGHWHMWRDTPEFSQRFKAELDPDAGAIRGCWEKSTDQGTTWAHDFEVDYIRERATAGQ
jgi:hypothetical protein